MTDSINSNGLNVQSYDELLSFVQNSMNQIYATDGNLINFGSETPDGQFTNILAQMGSDIRELIQEVYNSFDPSKCSGSVQDSRYALNYITRNAGTFTIQNIDVTVNQTVNLQGLDANYNDPQASSYTVSDNAGNLWYLIDSVELTAGTYSLPFRYQNYGLIQPTIGTITNQVTIVLGVVSVNNSVAPTTLGQDEEPDAQFRLRQERSTATRGMNNIDSMLAQILELEGVSDGDIHQNSTTETDSTGTPAGYIWVIVEGGANSEIADVIYSNACGRGTKGDVEVNVTTISGKPFTVNFDRPTPIPLYLRFDFQLTGTQEETNIQGIANYIAQNLIYSLNENAETSKPTTIAAQAITANGGGGYALNMEISTNGATWVDYIPSAAIDNKFVVDSTRITINTIEAS